MKLFKILLSILFISAPSIVFSQITADDFISPIQASSLDEKNRLLAVKDSVDTEVDSITGQNIVVSNSTQTAINYVVGQQSVGTQIIRVGSGNAWVATGSGTYITMENPTATRISKRNAYVRAYLNAKSELAKALNGMDLVTRTNYVEETQTISDDVSDRSRYQETLEESLEQSVQMMLKGFVVYSVQDDIDQNLVYVSIVTSPRIQKQYFRRTHNWTAASNLKIGLDQVLAEIQNSVLPLVGSRMITIDDSSKTAFIGFGSSVIQINSNPALQSKLRLNAEKIANMRASDALVGLLIGDDTRWKSKVDNLTMTMIQEFEQVDDIHNTDLEAFDQIRESFISQTISSTEMQSLRNGILPPGVQRKFFFSNDNAEVIAVAVYIPNNPTRSTNTSSFHRSDNVLTPSSTISPGPTGSITKDQDL